MSLLSPHLAKQAYFLTYKNKPKPTLVFHVQAEFLPHFQDLMNMDWMERIAAGLGTSYETSFEKAWGFGKGATNSRIQDGFLVLEFPLQKKWKTLNRPCPECHGKGYHAPMTHIQCFSCDGKGKEREMLQDHYFLTHSLSVLLDITHMILGGKSLPFEQDLAIKTSASMGSYGCAFSCDLSPVLFEKFRLFFDKHEGTDAFFQSSRSGPENDGIMWEPGARAISECYSYVEGISANSKLMDEDEIQCLIHRDGCFYIESMGINYCSLSVARNHEGWPIMPRLGRLTICHNLDSPAQQQSMLAGLTVLYHAVISEIP
jgi:hypothetical protein